MLHLMIIYHCMRSGQKSWFLMICYTPINGRKLIEKHIS